MANRTIREQGKARPGLISEQLRRAVASPNGGTG